MRGVVATNILAPKILLIENDPTAANEIRAALALASDGFFEVEWVRQLSEGLARLIKGGIDAVLLELSLPDSHGIKTFDKLFSAAPEGPILILGGNDNEALAKEALGRGAQGYLLPGHLTYTLPRAPRHATPR